MIQQYRLFIIICCIIQVANGYNDGDIDLDWSDNIPLIFNWISARGDFPTVDIYNDL